MLKCVFIEMEREYASNSSRLSSVLDNSVFPSKGTQIRSQKTYCSYLDVGREMEAELAFSSTFCNGKHPLVLNFSFVHCREAFMEVLLESACEWKVGEEKFDNVCIWRENDFCGTHRPLRVQIRL